MNEFTYTKYAPVVLRLGLTAVFIWFGLSQILNQDAWISFIPAWTSSLSGLSPSTLVIINGIFEVCMAVCLSFGVLIRPVALLLFLHMIGIIISVGLTPIGIRDIGIALGIFSIFLNGKDILSLSDGHKQDEIRKSNY